MKSVLLTTFHRRVSNFFGGAAVTIVGVAVGLLCLSGATGNAQTRFQHPDTTPDYSRYKSPFQCLAVTERVRQEFMQTLPFWKDTTQLNHVNGADTIPTTIVQATRRCLEKFDPNTQPVALATLWIRLYLSANRDDAAETMLRRRLENETPSGRRDALRAAVSLYGGAQPIRVKPLDEGISQLIAQTTDPVERILLYGYRMDVAERFDDSATMRRLSERIVELATTLTPNDKITNSYRMSGRHRVLFALNWLSTPALRDSLQKGATPYIALKRFNWIQAGPDSVNDDMRFVGKPSAPLVADIWSGSTDSVAPTVSTNGPKNGPNAVSRYQVPALNKTSLLVFLSAACRDEVRVRSRVDDAPIRPMCWEAFAVIRRLKERFPNLDVTMVSSAIGHVGEMGPLTPQDEARTLRTWWMEYHRLPVTIAMTIPESFLLADPDRRVIDHPSANELHYGFGFGQTRILYQRAFLIGGTGEILYSGLLVREREREFRQVLGMLER